MIDAIACERQFLDHLAPVWNELPSKGRFLVDSALPAKGIDVDVIDANALRRTSQQPVQPGTRPALVASIGDIKIGRRLGYGPFVFLEHGAGQWYGTDHASYSGGSDHGDVGLFLVPNEAVAARWTARYPGARVAIVGCPKIDTLPRRITDKTDPVLCVSFHWPAPDSIGNGLAGTAFYEYRDTLPALQERWKVIGHQHPNWLQRGFGGAPSDTYRRLGIPFVENFEDVCRKADVYICENSSTIWEFASTGRPVVLLNRAGWLKARGRVEYGPRFWDAADVGVQVDRPADLVAGIEQALEDSLEQRIARESAVSRVYTLRTNGAATAATAITDWLAR